jgi:hypothetical protein
MRNKTQQCQYENSRTSLSFSVDLDGLSFHTSFYTGSKSEELKKEVWKALFTNDMRVEGDCGILLTSTSLVMVVGILILSIYIIIWSWIRFEVLSFAHNHIFLRAIAPPTAGSSLSLTQLKDSLGSHDRVIFSTSSRCWR